MKNIKDLGIDSTLSIGQEIRYRGNEAELIPVIIKYKEYAQGILKDKEKEFLLRNCIIGDKEEHNREIKTIYDKITQINSSYQLAQNNYSINIVEHLIDDDGDIYIKNINSKDSFNVYDLIPDSYYVDPEKKEKSKFNEFKRTVNELKLNKVYIITKLFEQLAILHANNFVVGEIEVGDRKVKHPTLSLFLYKLKNKKGNINEEIFIHDIHNLELLENPGFHDYLNHCVADIKNMSFDIIRFFKGIGLPQGGFKIYGKVLKELNPELYNIMYRAFLRDPRIEIEISAIEKSDNENKKIKKTSTRILKELNSFKKEKKDLIKGLFSKDDIFCFAKSRAKIMDFFETINPENSEIIIDFDNTLTYPGSSNSLNIGFGEDSKLKEKIDIDYTEFFFRMGAISFLKLITKKGYKVKIYSLGLKEVIADLLIHNGLSLDNIEIFSNSRENIKYDKKEINLETDSSKRRLIIGDSLVDFDLKELTEKDLKTGFLNENIRNIDAAKKLKFNGLLDFYFINQNSNFVALYELFKKLD